MNQIFRPFHLLLALIFLSPATQCLSRISYARKLRTRLRMEIRVRKPGTTAREHLLPSTTAACSRRPGTLNRKRPLSSRVHFSTYSMVAQLRKLYFFRQAGMRTGRWLI